MISRKGILRLGRKGSTLLSVMVVTTILSLMLITLQPIMFRYAERSIEERDFKQADFSARSANDAIVSGVLAGDATLITGINSIAGDGSSLVLDDFTFTTPGMGNIEARIERVSAEEFLVITKAAVNDAQRTIGREINKQVTTGGPNNNALPAFYFHNLNGNSIYTTGNTPVVVKDSFIGGGGTNITITGDLYLLATNISFGGSAHMVIDGNFYTNSGFFTLNSGASRLTYKGTLYRGNGTRITTIVPTPADISTFNTIPAWVKSTGTPYTNAMTLIGGDYYVMNGNLSISDITSQLSSTVTPSNPVYIILRTGSTLSLSNAVDPPIGSVTNDPRVVFILEGTATLNVQHQSSLIVYGTQNTNLNVTNSSGGNPVLYGQVRVGEIFNNTGSYVILNYRAITSASVGENWTAGHYNKATY